MNETPIQRDGRDESDESKKTTKSLLSLLSALALLSSTASASSADSFDYTAFLKNVRPPTGFTINLAAGAPAIRFPMFACFDDAGRLYVAESSGNDLYAGLRELSKDCRVSRMEDTDGDGRFEKATVFAEGITFPMGIAWQNGRLYLADPPNLVALTDTDGDGRADKREIILSGFGHTDNGSLHGLTFGPDGMLYFTMGDPDGWKLPRGDGSFLEGTAGALFRSRPDGSRPEVISRGFVNLVEVEFLPGGEIIGTDNWFQQPAGGWRDALVDLAPGGLYPFSKDVGTPQPLTGVAMPPVVLLPAVAHSGMVRPRLAGLPSEWHGNLFVAEHNTRKIVRHELRREGSTWAATPHDYIVGEAPDFHPSDVLEAPDGSLLIVDTGGWYVEHCPTGRIRDSRAPGGIYRVRWTKKTGPPPDETKFAAVWKMSAPELRAQLSNDDESLVCATARALAFREDKSAGDALAALLNSASAPIRRAAAESLAICGEMRHAAPLVTALEKAGDAFEEHACIAALLAVVDEPFARRLLAHESPRVRRAALHLLDQPPFATLRFADLVAPLGDDALRDTARKLLEKHPSWAGEALPWLREQLASAEGGRATTLLVIFQNNDAVRTLIGDFLTAPITSESTRTLLLNLLPELNAQPPEAAWLRAIAPALALPTLRTAALNAAAAFPQTECDPLLTKLAEDETAPAAQRLLAARLARDPALSDGVFALVLASLTAAANAPDRLAAADLLARAHLAPSQLPPLLAALTDGAPVALEALLPALTRATDDTTRPAFAKFLAAKLAAAWSPDRATLEKALAIFPQETAAPLRAAWEKNNAATLARLKEFTPLLTGGDAERGRDLYATATCLGCHRIGGQGGVIGPDLTKIGAIRSGSDLLESILYPSSTFAQGYEPWLLTRRSGEVLPGRLISRGPEGVVLRDVADTLHRIPTTDIATFERQPLSTMPAGLEQLLTSEQFRDLLTYLQSLK